MQKEVLFKKWQFVSPDEFALPKEMASRKARTFLHRLFFKSDDKADNNGAEAVQTELTSAPQSFLDKVSPYPRWNTAAEALCQTLGSWLEDKSPNGYFRVFVAPYGSNLDEMLGLTAQAQGWQVLEPPDMDLLLSNDYSWIEHILQIEADPIVIPKLEGFFYRHHNGIEHLRRLVGALFHNKKRCIIGCNSWLWHYLDSAMHIKDCFYKYYYLQSLSAEDLQLLFCELETIDESTPTVFRQADNGTFVLPPDITGIGEFDPALNEHKHADSEFPSIFLKRLAAESRGIPMVAWAIWRNSLKIAPQEDVSDSAREAAKSDKTTAQRLTPIWVKAFKDIEIPQIPAKIGQQAAFLLLFLLQHGGLSTEAIFALLLFDKDQLIALLIRLQKSGIIVNESDIWRISWLGYPATRRFLAEQDLLQDSM